MKGDKVELLITSTGMNGDGVARLDNLAVFVSGALIGERVLAIITELKKNYARAKVIKIIEASKLRCEPVCEVFYRCGGCDMQHIRYIEQLRIKREELVSCLNKQGIKDIEIEEVVTSNNNLGYRNKLQLPIAMVDNKVSAGFYRSGTHTIVPITSCPLHGEWAEKIISAFLEYANINHILPYDERTRKGLLRHLVVRNINNKYSITVVINGNNLPNHKDLVNRTKESLNQEFSLFYSINKSNTNVIMGDNVHCVYGSERIEADILGLQVMISPLTFMQVNDAIRDLIYQRVEAMVGENDIVIDAYSGSGIMTALLARRAKLAVGIEIINEAVADADKLADINNLKDKMINLTGDVVNVLPEVIKVLNNQSFDKIMKKACLNSLKNDILSISSGRKAVANTNLNKSQDKFNIDNTGNIVRHEISSTLSCKASNSISTSSRKALDNNSPKENLYINNEAVNNSNETQIQNTVKELIIAQELPSKECQPTEEKLDNCCKANSDIESLDTFDNSNAAQQDKKEELIIVLDPPRKGCEDKVLQAVMSANPSKIIYISCNPATLARDLKTLTTAYTITSTTPYDMFPQTSHVEVLVCLSRKVI